MRRSPPKIGLRLLSGLSLWLSVCVAIATPASAIAQEEWTLHRTADGRHPNGKEQAMLWLMNRARQNPSAEGRWLARSSLVAVAGGRVAYDVDTDLLMREFDAIDPAPPAAFDARLYRAAFAHGKDQIARDVQDHQNQLTRVTRTGIDWRSCRGNVFSYAANALNTHAAFNIDWGYGPGGMQVARGHRKAIMASDQLYPNVGLAALVDRNAATNVGELVVVGNYCSFFTNSETDFNRFIVGTVWHDRNKTGRYEPGEGLSGVTIMPTTGRYYAVTSRGGGYAFPVRANVEMFLHVSGPSMPSTYKRVRVDRHSTLVDFELGDLTEGNSENPDNDNNENGEISAPGSEIELIPGVRNQGRFGWKYGTGSHLTEVVAAFEHYTDADYELQVTGVDINGANDVAVFVNDVRATTLKSTARRSQGARNRVVVSRSLLKQGINKIKFVKRRPGDRWGVSGILLRDESGPVVALVRDALGTGYFGGNTSRNLTSHRVALHLTFDGAGEDLSLSGRAEDIDFDGEVWVYLNGRRLNTLPTTGDYGRSEFKLELPRTRQKEGVNTLEFRLSRAQVSWSVGDLELR